MFEMLRQFDVRLLLSVNSRHSPLLDVLMQALSSTWTWLPVLGLILYLFFRRHGWPRLLCILLCNGALYGLTIAGVSVIKHGVERQRPFLHLELASQLHLPAHLPGSEYGFISSHTAAAFAFAVFGALLLHRRWATLSLPLWACAVAYSRVYLGVHFPADVVGGAIWGSTLAGAAYLLWRLIPSLQTVRHIIPTSTAAPVLNPTTP